MNGPIEELMTADHARLDRLLESAESDPTAYQQFRAGLLRHIGMEEKILLRALRAEGVAVPIARQLRHDHGTIASLLVPPPEREILDAIRTLLARHNPLEEGEHGLYRLCDQTLGPDVLRQLELAPDVPMMPNSDTPLVRQHVARVLKELGR